MHDVDWRSGRLGHRHRAVCGDHFGQDGPAVGKVAERATACVYQTLLRMREDRGIFAMHHRQNSRFAGRGHGRQVSPAFLVEFRTAHENLDTRLSELRQRCYLRLLVVRIVDARMEHDVGDGLGPHQLSLALDALRETFS